MFGRVLARERENTKGHRDPMDSVTARDNIRRIYTSLSYLHENLSQPISVPFLAEMEHLGVSRYRALFHAATGMPPIADLTDLRMKRAAEEALSIKDYDYFVINRNGQLEQCVEEIHNIVTANKLVRTLWDNEIDAIQKELVQL